MSRGRHRGRTHWGILPKTGQSLNFLPYDIAIIAIRCFGLGTSVFGVAGVALLSMDARELTNVVVGVAFAVGCSMFAVGFGLMRYQRSALKYAKAKQADEWIHVVHQCRIQMLMEREELLTHNIAELNNRFEEEKKALQEIREERMAQERMMGFVEGLQKSPAMKAYLANPRNRLRVVPSPAEHAETDKAG